MQINRLLVTQGIPVLVGLAAVTPATAQNGAREPDLVTVEVTTVGVGVTSGAHVVVLHDPASEKAMPVWIGDAEAEAIARSLYEIATPRPMTHDLLAQAIRSLGATVTEVRVRDSRNGVYLGAVSLRTQDAKSVELDSRPSDAVALALRTGAPIRVARHLLDQAPPIDVMPRDSAPEVARVIGLTVVAQTAELQRIFHLPRRDGVVILQTTGPAAEAGLQRGDLIIEVNGMIPQNPMAFYRAVRGKGGVPGPIRLRYWRQGGEQETQIKLVPPTDQPIPAKVE